MMPRSSSLARTTALTSARSKSGDTLSFSSTLYCNVVGWLLMDASSSYRSLNRSPWEILPPSQNKWHGYTKPCHLFWDGGNRLNLNTAYFHLINIRDARLFRCIPPLPPLLVPSATSCFFTSQSPKHNSFSSGRHPFSCSLHHHQWMLPVWRSWSAFGWLVAVVVELICQPPKDGILSILSIAS